MGKPTWIIQETNYSNDCNGPQNIIFHLREKEYPVISFKYGGQGSDFSFLKGIKDPAVFYGTLNVIEDLRAQNIVTPNPFVWYNPRKFDYSYYYFHLHQYMLNNHFTCTSLRALEDVCFGEANRIFIKPDANNKIFNAQLLDREYVKHFFRDVVKQNNIPLSTKIITCAPKKIDREWRFFVVDKKVVAGSQYKENGSVDINPHFPEDAYDFAQEVANHWQPAPVWVLDVCLSEGKHYALEIGPFNYAGLYKAKVSNIVDAINEYVQTNT